MWELMGVVTGTASLLLTFFALRVAPVPYLGTIYVRGHFLVPTIAPKMNLFYHWPYGCGLDHIEWWVSVISIAIPVCLNQYWFCKMLAKARRALNGTSRATQDRRERERIRVGKKG